MDTPEYQRHSKCRLKTTVFVGASQQDMHGEYADKQLVNLQKRIFLIEFLHLGLVIVYQGTYPLPPKIENDPKGSFFILLKREWVDPPERQAHLCATRKRSLRE